MLLDHESRKKEEERRREEEERKRMEEERNRFELFQQQQFYNNSNKYHQHVFTLDEILTGCRYMSQTVPQRNTECKYINFV